MSEPRANGVAAYDYDWLIVGSGFGGSVSAMRLTEKGYSVGMLRSPPESSQVSTAE